MRGEINYLGFTTEFNSSHLEFYRDTKRNGKPLTQVFFGGFRFSIPSNSEGLRFLEELLKIDKQFQDPELPNPLPSEMFKPFIIKIYDSQGYIIREIKLIDAHIQNYHEAFNTLHGISNNSNTSMEIEIHMYSAIQSINDRAINVFRWRYSDYAIKEYQPPVNTIEETKKKKCRLEFDIVDKKKWRNDEFGFHKITPEKKMVAKKRWGYLKTIHKTLQDKIADKEYIPHWLSIRKGQTIKLKLKWSGDRASYTTIAFDNTPDFSFNITNLKDQKEVEITCLNDAGTNTDGTQLLVKGDNKDVVGAINVFYPKPKSIDIRCVLIEIFGEDEKNLQEEKAVNINSKRIRNTLETALNPALIDLKSLCFDVLDLQKAKDFFLKHHHITETAPELNAKEVKYHAIYLPNEKTTRGYNYNIMRVFGYAENKDLTNKLNPNGIDIYIANIGNLPSAKDIKDGQGFEYAAGLSPTGQGKAYLFLDKEGKIRDEHIVHEILHGIGLEHTFNTEEPIAYKKKTTDNYMDYKENLGDKYTTEKWQWEQIHNSPYTK